jgi:hypothetical protein
MIEVLNDHNILPTIPTGKQHLLQPIAGADYLGIPTIPVIDGLRRRQKGLAGSHKRKPVASHLMLTKKKQYATNSK